jgi:hypothetical protein
LFLLLDYMHLFSTLLLTDSRTLERRKVFLLGTYENGLLIHFLEEGSRLHIRPYGRRFYA